MALTVNTSQLGMAFYLLLATLANILFLVTSYRRLFKMKKENQQQKRSSTFNDIKLFYSSVFLMALMDIPWVWLCMIQCMNNAFTADNKLHQDRGNETFGCIFMGWYSTFSVVSMMGSHCIVVFYFMKYLQKVENNGKGIEVKEGKTGENGDTLTTPTTRLFRESIYDFSTGSSVFVLGLFLFVLASLFASMPLLLSSSGYILTNGGFCYADLTNTIQATIILIIVTCFLLISTILWRKIVKNKTSSFLLCCTCYGFFLLTWILWIPASLHGIRTGKELPSPYMILGAIFGHGNAIINPFLYGWLIPKKFFTTESMQAKKEKELVTP